MRTGSPFRVFPSPPFLPLSWFIFHFPHPTFELAFPLHLTYFGAIPAAGSTIEHWPSAYFIYIHVGYLESALSLLQLTLQWRFTWIEYCVSTQRHFVFTSGYLSCWPRLAPFFFIFFFWVLPLVCQSFGSSFLRHRYLSQSGSFFLEIVNYYSHYCYFIWYGCRKFHNQANRCSIFFSIFSIFFFSLFDNLVVCRNNYNNI